MVKEFHIKQKFWSIAGKFDIYDQLGTPAYQVEGSFMKLFKEFTVTDIEGRFVSKIKHQFSLLLPKFTVTMADGSQFMIQKEFTFFKDKYNISGVDLQVHGDWWDMNFTLSKDGQEVARISQEWLKLTSTYNVTVLDDQYADLVISLVIAIDYVKAAASSAASSGSVGH